MRKNRQKCKHNGGFTLVETLVVVAILVVLLAVSAVSVIRYRDVLKIVELDNAAREIYMAAENRAVLLKDSAKMRTLSTSESESDMPGEVDVNGENFKYVDSDYATENDLLTTGAIDPALLEGDFYIVYEPESGSVTDVFYVESGSTIETIQGDFAIASDRNARMKREKGMLGYYGGESSGSLDYTSVSNPGVNVEITNDEILTVEVTFTLPEGYDWDSADMTVELTYGDNKVTLFNNSNSAQENRFEETEDGNTMVCTWVLDKLDYDDKTDLHFKDLFEGTTVTEFGDNFTVKAAIELKQEGSRSSTATASDTNNSLFADGSGNGTAYIKCLRHLQNLDKDTSKVNSNITKAVQIADIECGENNGTYVDYEFIPIQNDKLESFSVNTKSSENKNYEIRELNVTTTSVGTKTGAGLFAVLDGGENADDSIKIEGLRLVNAQVAGPDNTPAGAAAGMVRGNVTFTDCRVYWETDEDGESYTDLLLDSDGSYKYIITSTSASAGGLVGSVSGDSTVKIDKSFAATMVSGNHAGGLIGLVGDNAELDVSVSYADCYLQGTSVVGGLVGSCGENASLTLTNVYTAGFVDGTNAASVGGICGSSAGGTSENVYAAMYYTNVEGVTTAYPGVPGNCTNCYYMTSNGLDSSQNNAGNGKPYDSMTESNFFNTMGDAFTHKNEANSNPYNLQANQNLAGYKYPGLKALPHYGDWKAYLKGPVLVYYEKYSDNSYGISGSDVSDLKTYAQLGDDYYVEIDGYAMALKTDSVKANSVEVTYTYFDGSELAKEPATYDEGGRIQITYDTGEYYLFPLPDEIINSTYPSPYFYQYLGVKFEEGLDKDLDPDSEYFFNPHFAATARAYNEEGTLLLENDKENQNYESVIAYVKENLLLTTMTVSIRTPRHLYDLSKFSQYYNYNNGKLSFVQELDLDYSKYSGYGFNNAEAVDENGEAKWPAQTPIGKSGSAFNGTYNGGCHYIKNVPMDWSNPQYAGLFGYSGGTLKNIVFIMNTKTTQSVSVTLGTSTYNIGALVGYNSATVSNCAVAGVNLKVNTGGSTTAYIGGLVGYNIGWITNSAAEVASVDIRTTSKCTIYAGGLVGRNTYLVSKSYAVGSMSATTTKDGEEVYLCGFVGMNTGGGTVNNSYAAMNLEADGDGASAYGFCHESYQGTQNNTYYLDGSTFTYRGESYLAGFDKNQKAQPATYAQLTGNKENPITLTGMTANVTAKYKDDNTEYTVDGNKFPYFSAVTDANGYYVHYGLWPARMNMGNMGVYYWEELERNGEKTYHISILAVNPDGSGTGGTITKDSTLSTLHDEGGEVTRYGYGFYNSTGESNTITVDDGGTLYYTYNDYDFADKYKDLETQKKNTTNENDPLYLDKLVDEALASQTEGFEFHSFHTYEIDKDTPTGLYPAAGNQNCTLTLKQGELEVEFTISPFFADALSVKKPDNWTLKQMDGSDVSFDSGEEAQRPGGAKNPYEVRSVSQLQLINWNYKEKDAHIVMDSNNSANFRYLNSNSQTTHYNWTQTYDLVGSEENGDNKTTTPIAEYYDTTAGNNSNGALNGWFGGVYDGSGYKIENVNVEGHALSSCAGLFGVVYNGTLKDIVLYSSNGNGKISTLVYEGTSGSCWFAMGALAGVAGTSSDNSGSAIQNCSVAGYTIEATAFTASGGWGGNCIGGMVGESNMDLSGCSAVVYVNIHDAVENDNMRVGGLVGACQGSITQCYAGGEIAFINETDENGNEKADSSVNMLGGAEKGIYVGGLVGGSYIKPLKVDDGQIGQFAGSNVDNNLINCYSYVTLPRVTSHSAIRGLYAVGGTGEIDPEDYIAGCDYVKAGNQGKCTMKNCFYLESEVLKRNNNVTISGVTINGETTGTFSGQKAIVFYLWTKDPIITYVDNKQYKGFLTMVRPGKTDMNVYYTPPLDSSDGKPDWDNYPIAIPVTYEQLVGDEMISVPITSSGYKKSEENTEKVEISRKVSRDNPYKQEGSVGNKTDTVYEWDTKEHKEDYIYNLLNEETTEYVNTDMFDKVKTEVNGISVPGRYSYPTDEHPELKDLNYPFPTNQTMVIDDAGTKAHVHYGNWPLNGFYRASVETDESDTPIRLNYLGVDPIEIDLFATDSEYKEYLVLSDVGTGGAWTLEFESDTHPEVIIHNEEIEKITINGTTYTAVPMTVKGNTAGTFPLTITYTVNEVPYKLTVYIIVDAMVQLEPEKVYMFPDDSVKVELTPYNSEKDEPKKLEGTVSLTNLIVLGSEETLTAEPTGSTATFTTSGADLGTYTVNAMFSYTHTDGQSYDCEDAIEIEVIQPWKVDEWQEVVEDPPDDTEEGTTTEKQYVSTITIPATFNYQVDGTATDTLKLVVGEINYAVGKGITYEVKTNEENGETIITLTYTQTEESTESSTFTFPLTVTVGDDDGLVHQVTITVSAPPAYESPETEDGDGESEDTTDEDGTDTESTTPAEGENVAEATEAVTP